MPVHILYEDEFLLVCEKPAGISSESPGFPELVAGQIHHPVWPVHRLDAGTGGVIILARSSSSCSTLQKLFQENLVRKEYLAVISGLPPDLSGCYKDYLYHDRIRNKTYVVPHMRSGVRKAECDWTVIGREKSDDPALCLVRVLLHTGRTHQIRVQFASRGFPLVGDRRYGSQIKADTPALWAAGIRFPHPYRKNQAISVSSSPPSSFPWNLF